MAITSLKLVLLLNSLALPASDSDASSAIMPISLRSSGIYIHGNSRIEDAAITECLSIMPAWRITPNNWVRSQITLYWLYVGLGMNPTEHIPVIVPTNPCYCSGVIFVDLAVYVPF